MTSRRALKHNGYRRDKVRGPGHLRPVEKDEEAERMTDEERGRKEEEGEEEGGNEEGSLGRIKVVHISMEKVRTSYMPTCLST